MKTENFDSLSVTMTINTLKIERQSLIRQYNTLKETVESLEEIESTMIAEIGDLRSEEFEITWNQANEYRSKANDILNAINALGNAINHLNGKELIDIFWG